VAILPVLLYHAFPRLAPGGFIGVDIFLVISGYLISQIIFRALEAGRFSFRDFYARRVRRLFPALIVVLSSVYAFGWLALLPDQFKQLGKHIAAGSVYVQNIVLELEAGYFDTASELKPLLHLWSLAVEEQFYLMYPLFAWTLWRIGRKYFLIGVLVAATLSLTASIVGVYSDPTRTFYYVHTRFWELMTGAMIAYFHLFGSSSGDSTCLVHRAFLGGSLVRKVVSPVLQLLLGKNLLTILGLALVSYGIFYLDGDQPYPGVRALIPVLGTSLVILATDGAWINRHLLGNRAMVYIGLISYPLYLWHWPLLAYLRITEQGDPPRSWRLGALLVSFALSSLTYHLIEHPIRHGKGFRFLKTIALVVVAFSVGGLGYWTWLKDGIPSRIDANILDGYFRYGEVFDPKNAPWAKDKQSEICFENFRPVVKDKYKSIVFCRKDSLKPSNVLLVGDSHAISLYPGLYDMLLDTKWVIEYNGGSGVSPLRGLAVKERKASSDIVVARQTITDAALDRALNSPEINTVILAGRWPLYFSATGFGETEAQSRFVVNSYRHPELSDPEAIFEDSLRATFGELLAKGKRVIFVLDTPELGFDPRTCVNFRPFRLHPKPPRTLCALPRNAFEQRRKGYIGVLNEVLKDFPQVVVVDGAEPFCDRQWCFAMKDGKMLYIDDDHVSVYGARLMASKILAHLLQTEKPVSQANVGTEPTKVDAPQERLFVNHVKGK